MGEDKMQTKLKDLIVLTKTGTIDAGKSRIFCHKATPVVAVTLAQCIENYTNAVARGNKRSRCFICRIGRQRRAEFSEDKIDNPSLLPIDDAGDRMVAQAGRISL